MIEKDMDMFSINCDNCGKYEWVEGNFADAIEFMRDNGWKSIKEDGEWLTYCPICKQKI